MIGRLYVWRGTVWRLLVRGEPFDRGPRRNVLLQPVIVHEHPQHGWHAIDADGLCVVRPFRGLQRWAP